MESDKKLDKLESFLGRLNSKGVYPTRGVHVTSHYLLDGQCLVLLACCAQWQVFRKPRSQSLRRL